MKNTTLCYVIRGDQVLMLHRVKKKNDINHDKWIGIGGKFLPEESPDECLLREVWEETGLTLTSWRCRGVVTFLNTECEGEFMYLFTADGFEGKMHLCDEGGSGMGQPGISEQPSHVGRRQDLSGSAVAGCALLSADPALPGGYSGRGRTERRGNS